MSYIIIARLHIGKDDVNNYLIQYKVEPPNKGHLELGPEVVLFSEV